MKRVTTGGFSPQRLARVQEVLERYVDSGCAPGAVAAVARHGEVHIEAAGTLAFEGEGSGTPMAADTICRIALDDQADHCRLRDDAGGGLHAAPGRPGR